MNLIVIQVLMIVTMSGNCDHVHIFCLCQAYEISLIPTPVNWRQLSKVITANKEINNDMLEFNPLAGSFLFRSLWVYPEDREPQG